MSPSIQISVLHTLRRQEHSLSKETTPFHVKTIRAGRLTFDLPHPDHGSMPLVLRAFKSLIYHLKTIWLFTASDLKTIVGPKSAFGITHALYASEFGIPPLPVASILARALLTILWCWINLLPFNISNQHQTAAIIEDSVNKPWRPLPSHRLSQKQARLLMVALYPIAILVSSQIGGLHQCLTLIILGFLYNDCGGADASCISRNVINGIGFVCYAWGAMEVALGSNFIRTIHLINWFALICLVVATSVHTQDMYDQDGDSMRNRKTVPLVIGDSISRWTIATSVGFWSLICPSFWGIANIYIIPPGLGILIMYRTLMNRSVEADKRTFRLWNAWMVTLYLCPVISSTLYC